MTDLQKIHNGCAVCHAQFGSLKAFDKHQDVDYARSPTVMCRTPEGLGLVQDGHGVWVTPQRLADNRRCAEQLQMARSGGHTVS